MPSTDASTRVLLVEGQDDEHVVRHILRRVGSIGDFDISERQGVDRLLDTIRTEIRVPGREVVGIVVDANDDRPARWHAVRDRLRSAGIAAPDEIGGSGLIIDGTPRIGVWLMPDNVSPGELEDFVAAMIPTDDTVWGLARDYIAGIPKECQKFATAKTRRAEVHAWLATREDPRQMGAAIGARDLDVSAPLSQRFVAWLRELYGEADA